MPRPFSDQPFTDFLGQYEWAKEKFSQAIQNNKNIVLYGKGGNGKSHLTQEHEFYNFFEDYKYVLKEVDYESKILEVKRGHNG